MTAQQKTEIVTVIWNWVHLIKPLIYPLHHGISHIQCSLRGLLTSNIVEAGLATLEPLLLGLSKAQI